MYSMTPPTAPKPQKKKMHVLQIIIIAAAVLVALWYLIKTLMPAASPYATIQAGTLGARYSGDALIVREEIPYDAEGVSSIEYVAEEGKLVRNRNTICNVFSTGYSTKETTALQSYRDQIKEYQLQLIGEETTYDAKMERLDSDVLELAKEFRAMIGGQRGNLLNQEKLLDAAIGARQLYLKKKYGSDQRLSRLYDDEQSQEQRIASWTKQYTASGDTLVSFYTDGYEYGLTTSNFRDFTPAEVRRMINGQKPELSTTQKGKTTIYRTIRDGTWYVLMLVKDSVWNPVEGQSYELKLERVENTQVMATVESFTRSGGELLVRLVVNDSVEPVMYMRTCQAELGDYVQSLMVPKRAIYTQDNMTGVVVLDGSNKLFIPINILLEDGGNVYISAITQGLLYEGQTVLLF